MNLTTKILITLGVILTLGALGFIIYRQEQISTRQDAIQTQMVAMKQLADNISRAQATYATSADLDAFAKQHDLDLQAIKNDLATLNASVTAINLTTVNSQGQVATNLPSTSATPNDHPPLVSTPPTVDCNGTPLQCPSQDTYGYLSNRQVLHLDEQFMGTAVPIGDVGFSAWQKNPWDINISPRIYSATTVLGTDENQRQYAYNKFTIKVGNKEFPVKISNNSFMQEYPTAKFSAWNPRLYLGMDSGINLSTIRPEVSPNLSVHIMSYGQYKTQPDFTFVGVGVGYGMNMQKPQVVLTPITYNLGKHIPLMNNLYVGPSILVGTDGSVAATVGFHVGM